MVSNMTKAQLEKELKNALERIAVLENHAPIVNENLKFRALIENSKDVFGLISADGNILYKSPSVLEVMGYTPEELAKKNIFEILHPEDETANMKVFEKIMAEPGGTFNTQTRYKHKNGEWRWVDITATNLLYEEGVGAIAISYCDVTKQHQMQAQLQNDEFRYRTLFEDAPIPLLEEDFSGVQKKLFQLRENGIIDLRGYLYSHPEFVIECISLVQILDVNKAAVKLFGAAQKKDLLIRLDKIVGRENIKAIADQLLALESGQTTYFWEGVNYTLEGKEIRVQIHLLVPPGHEESLSRVMVAMTDVTARQKTEAALKKSEMQYRLLADNMSDMVWLMDLDLQAFYISPSTEKIHGYTLEDLRSMTLEEQLTPESYERAMALYTEELSTASPSVGYEIDLEFYRRDGSTYWSSNTFKVIWDENDQPVMILGVGRDITNKKIAGEELRKSEERYRSIAEDMPAMICRFTVDGTLTFVNSLFCNYFNATYEALLGSNFFKLIPETERENIREKYLSLNYHTPFMTYEYKAVDTNGKDYWQRWTDRALFNDQGEVVEYQSIGEDITESRKAEEALRQAEEKYRAIFENSLEGIFQSTPAGRFITVNPALASMWKYDSPEDMITSITDIAHQIYTDPSTREEHIRLLKEQGGNLTVFEYQAYCKDGSIIWVSESVHSILDADGTLLYYEGTVINISARKQAEEVLRESEKRFRSLFEDSPISLWEDDYSKVKQKLDELKSEGVTDFESYFTKHPEEAAECLSLIKIVDANKYSVKLFNTKDKEELLQKSSSLLVTDYLNIQELVNIASGMTYFEWEGVNKKVSGELMNLKLSWSVVPGCEEDLSKVIISIVDITDRKKADTAISRQLSELETLYESGLSISRLLSPKAIAQKVIEILDRRMNWHHIAIRQYRVDTNSVELLAFNRPNVSPDEADEFISRMNSLISNPSQGLSGWVTLNGKSIRVPNVKNDERYIEVFSEICSGLYVPLKIGDRVLGSISVESTEENAFSEQDERLLETLAVQAAIAIENANLFLTTEKEIMERQQAEAMLKIKTTELLQLNNQLEQRVKERTVEIEVTRKRLQLATDAAKLGIWEWNNVNGHLIWDAHMYRIYGISPEEFGGKLENIYEFILPEDQIIMYETGYNIVVNLITSYQIEYRILRKDGEIRTLAQQGTAIFNEHNVLERIIGTVTDITRQKKAEQALRESEAYARLLFESAPDPIFVGGVEGKILDVNKVFEIQHHVKREDIRGRTLSELSIFPAEELEKIKKYLADVAQGKDDLVEINFNNPGAGEMHTLEMSAFPIEVQGSQFILSTTHDITLHKKAEEFLRRANTEMERALRMKDEFLANMSHELRTPLNAVLGMSESLEEQIAGPLNEKQLKYIRTISESGKHLLELINDILDLSKIEAGRLELSVSQVSVSALCQASMRMVKEQAQKKNQQVSLNIDPEVKIIMGDERRLKQALVNLLSNAVKFTPNDKQIGVDVKGNARNQTVTFTVWDEGIGMTPEELKLIFKPFVQLDSGLAREFSGTGLGLVLVSQMIRLHGGSVSVESKQGQGSRFSIILPWVDVEGTVSVKQKTQETEAGPTFEKKRGIKILIVEDTDSIIMLVSEYLRYKGYQVLIARNGMEGFDLALKEKPDLILMDVMMPVMNGVEATEKIRAEKELQEIPIIALTALAMASDRERCLQAGMNDYISKPVEMKELENMVLKHLSVLNEKTAPPT